MPEAGVPEAGVPGWILHQVQVRVPVDRVRGGEHVLHCEARLRGNVAPLVPKPGVDGGQLGRMKLKGSVLRSVSEKKRDGHHLAEEAGVDEDRQRLAAD